MSDEQAMCEVCGDPMPAGEQMFKFHGYSGPCPKPPKGSDAGARKTSENQQAVAPGAQSGFSEWMIDAASAIQQRCFEKHPKDIPTSTEIADFILKYRPKPASDRDVAAYDALLAACVLAVSGCKCRGTGKWETDCTLCGDSTFDHVCNERVIACNRPFCVAARAAIALAQQRTVVPHEQSASAVASAT